MFTIVVEKEISHKILARMLVCIDFSAIFFTIARAASLVVFSAFGVELLVQVVVFSAFGVELKKRIK
jgi:hypothetical protein